MITGGVASVIYGDPRFTRDVDLVLELGAPELPAFESAFDPRDYVPPTESLLMEVGRQAGGHFNVIHKDTALRADVYLAGDDPFHAWALARRLQLELEESTVHVAPIEYVVVRKLEYFTLSGSDRHLRDVAMMLRVSADAVDTQALEAWAGRRGVTEVLATARDFA